MHHPRTSVIGLCLLTLVLLPTPEALAHGEVDEKMVAEFHLHLDDLREDVHHLIDALDPIVTAHAAGRTSEALVAEFTAHWEDAGLHAVIEHRAPAVYGDVWKAISRLQRAAAAVGGPTAELEAATEAVKAALWQGFGAVRLAASQVDAAAPAASP